MFVPGQEAVEMLVAWRGRNPRLHLFVAMALGMLPNGDYVDIHMRPLN